jgi:HlyD family secretion protein
MSGASDEQGYLQSIGRQLAVGGAVLGVLVVGVFGWAGATDIAGAVLAPGAVIVESNVKKVQHPTGGIVGEIRVRDGVPVKAGDLLLRLDETTAKASLAIVTKNLNELTARKARLEAERDEIATVAFPGDLLDRAAKDPEVARVVESERKVFDLRIAARTGQKKLLNERSGQLNQEIAGHEAQERGKAKELTLIQTELDGARQLWKKNLMPITKLTALEREAARLEGERGQILSAMAQGKGKLAEIDLQVIQIDRDAASEVGRELREVEGKIGELIERKVAAEDQMRRIDIRAPQSGLVHQSVVHTVGGVVAPGETLMLIVPESDQLAVEAKVAPNDIDQLSIGQPALLRFTAFSQRTTPEINGRVSQIGADITTDTRTGISYYTVRVSFAPEEAARLGEVRLVPGMPVEAMMKTADRKVISYLIKPLQDQLTRAFREQ